MSKRSKTHTPGPWRIEPHVRKGVIHPAAVIAADNHWIAPGICGHDHQGSDMANARLVAAAPELFAGAKAMMDLPRGGYPYAGRETPAEQAALRKLLMGIAKAEGDDKLYAKLVAAEAEATNAG